MPLRQPLVLRHVDQHVIVVEKPAGIPTVRHPAERDWLADRRERVPTLDDLVLLQLGVELPRQKHERRPRLRIVHRGRQGDERPGGLRRTVEAERGLGGQFKRHTVHTPLSRARAGRRAAAVRSMLVRDRGDGKRGSGATGGKEAITHVAVVEPLPGYTLLSCKLETGRTHQIRIHLAELGHPVCGDVLYRGKFGLPPIVDTSGALRLALHATELGFAHPTTGEPMHWEMPLPEDLRLFVEKLRTRSG